MERNNRHIKLIGPTILIGLGIILLLNNLGYLDWSIWDILSLWPVLLIAAGLEILIGRRSILGSIVAALLVLGLIVAAVWFVGVADSPRRAVKTTTIAEARSGIMAAEVSLAPSVAQLTINALNDSGSFVEGTIEQHQNERLVQDFAGGTPARLSVKTSGTPKGHLGAGSRQRWDLAFHPDVALDLTIALGLGEGELDFRHLTLKTADLNFGAGDMHIKLPEEGDCEINIDGGVGSIVIEVPPGLAVRLQTDTALVARTLPPDYVQSNNRYTSPNYSKAEKKVNIRIGLGIGNLTLRQTSEQ